jgi:hypothetical protein
MRFDPSSFLPSVPGEPLAPRAGWRLGLVRDGAQKNHKRSRVIAPSFLLLLKPATPAAALSVLLCHGGAHDGKPKFGWCGYPRLVPLSSKMSVRVPNMGADTSRFSHYSNKLVRIPK